MCIFESALMKLNRILWLFNMFVFKGKQAFCVDICSATKVFHGVHTHGWNAFLWKCVLFTAFLLLQVRNAYWSCEWLELSWQGLIFTWLKETLLLSHGICCFIPWKVLEFCLLSLLSLHFTSLPPLTFPVFKMYLQKSQMTPLRLSAFWDRQKWQVSGFVYFGSLSTLISSHMYV